jgi:hypothetical protein
MFEVEGKAEKQARHEDLRLGMNRVSAILAPRLEMRLLLRTLFRLPSPLAVPNKKPGSWPGFLFVQWR